MADDNAGRDARLCTQYKKENPPTIVDGWRLNLPAVSAVLANGIIFRFTAFLGYHRDNDDKPESAASEENPHQSAEATALFLFGNRLHIYILTSAFWTCHKIAPY